MAKRRSKKGRTDTAASPHDETYTWTIMLYLAGDNNLSDEMVWALKEIYRVGTPEGVAVTLQFDPLARGRTTRFFQAPSSGATIDIDGIFPILHDDELGEVDDGDPDTVAEFVVRSIKAAPAQYYMLILAGHGSGIVGDFLSDTHGAIDLGQDSLTIPTLGQTLRRLQLRLAQEHLQRKGVAIDVLGLDSCLMSMAEICSEVAGEVTCLVGSEGFDPNTGWPYFRLLEELRARQEHLPAPQDLADLLVKLHVLYYADYDDAEVSVDMSACEVQRGTVAAIEQAVARFVEFYLDSDSDPLIRNAVVLAHWKAQSYKWEQYTDLVDFCDQLQNECANLQRVAAHTRAYAELRAICGAVVTAVNDAISSSNSAGPEFQHSHGLSVYFPWSRMQYADEYRCTRFAARTGWDRFLERYIDGTRRSRRDRELAGPEPSGSPRPSDPSVMVNEAGGVTLIGSRVTTPVRAPSPHRAGSAASTGQRPSSAARVDALARLEQDSSSTGHDVSSGANAPSNRVNAPSNRGNAPSNRGNAPSNRVNAPSNRFAQYIGTLMNELPSSMKNFATDAEPVVTFTFEDRTIVRRRRTKRRRQEPSSTGKNSRARRPH